jgi:hypothetical protein
MESPLPYYAASLEEVTKTKRPRHSIHCVAMFAAFPISDYAFGHAAD